MSQKCDAIEQTHQFSLPPRVGFDEDLPQMRAGALGRAQGRDLDAQTRTLCGRIGPVLGDQPVALILDHRLELRAGVALAGRIACFGIAREDLVEALGPRLRSSGHTSSSRRAADQTPAENPYGSRMLAFRADAVGVAVV